MLEILAIKGGVCWDTSSRKLVGVRTPDVIL